MKPLQKMLVLLGLISLTGCQLIDIRKISNEVDASHDEAAQLAAKAKQSKPIGARKTQSIEHVSGLWLPSRKMSVTKEQQNPALTRKITVNRSFSGIEDAAERITILTGIPVTVAPDAAGARGQPIGVGGAGLNPISNPIGGTAAPIGVTVPAIGSTAGTPITATTGLIPGAVNLVYNGTLSGFLDVVAARYSVNWDWHKNNIRFFRVTSKTFRIAALPGDTTLSATVSAQSNNQGAGSSGTGSSTSGVGSSGSSLSSNNNQAAGVTLGLSVWKDIEASIKTMLTPLGKAVVTPATGTITVMDTPKALAQVEQFVEQQNQSLGRQVAVNVKVLAVQLDNGDNYGIKWDLIFKNLSDIGVTLSSGVSGVNVAEGASSLVLSAPPNSNFNGSEAIFSALSTQGKVSQVTSASITTLNNQPAPLQVGKQTSYLASSETTSAGLGNITTTLTPGSITTGFSMNLVPHILDDNKLLLQYAVNLSSLIKLETITSGGTTINGVTTGGATIQAPNIDTRNFLQRVSLNSGDTLVVAGFEQSDLKAESQGVGDADNTALGGSKKSARGKTVIVVLLQPVIAN